MKRTQEEISRQIDGLKKMKETLPEINFFGDNNWKQIDAQISVVSGKEDADYFRNADDETFSAAENAEQWLQGHSNDDLFDED